MKTDLWVIWFALLVAVGFTAFEFGGFFPAKWVARRIRQEGWDAGFDRGFPHGARADGIDPAEWLPAEPQWQYGPRWDDTVEDLMQRGRSYYEPLARGAGANLPPVTTAPRPGVEETMSPKGDSPGPGLPPLPDFPLPAENPDYPFPSSVIFDDLAANWRTASSSTPYETSAPLGSPPGGAEPEPSIREVMPHEHEPRDRETVGHMSPPAPVLAPANNLHDPGAGADPWHQIAQANHDIWEIFDDAEVFGMIRWDIAALKRKLAEPYRLTPWKGAA